MISTIVLLILAALALFTLALNYWMRPQQIPCTCPRKLPTCEYTCTAHREE